MWQSFVARLLNKYQWAINPFVGRRDRLTLLMHSYDFVSAPFKIRKHYNVFWDGGRLIGIFFTNFPGDIFNTQLRICVYWKRDFTGEAFGKEKYCLTYMFSHGEQGKSYKLGSHAKTEWLEFSELVAYLKTAKNLSDSRTAIFTIQEMSKVDPQRKTQKTT